MPDDDDALPNFQPRYRWVRDALREAYALAAEAQSVVGELDQELARRAQELMEQLDMANGQANTREQVFERGISAQEYRARLGRAKDSIKALESEAKRVGAQAEKARKTWRKAMVRQLLGPGVVIKKPRGTPSKLTPSQHEEIAARYRAGERNILQLAKEYDVSRRTIDRRLKAAGLKDVAPRK